MKTYWNTNGSLNAIPEWQPNCWIQVTCPTEEDQQELEETYKIPDYFLSDISDTDERPAMNTMMVGCLSSYVYLM